MEVLLALKDGIESDARMDAKLKKAWIDHLVVARKEFYNRWVKEDVHRALFASFEDEAQQLLDKYLDEVEAALDQREVKDPITGEDRARPTSASCARSRTRSRSRIPASSRSARRSCARRWWPTRPARSSRSRATRGCSEAIEQYLFEERRDVLRLVTSAARPDDEAQRKISAVQERMIEEYGYDEHSAREALSYVTTLLAQE